jgi:hypothetical protein
MYLYLICRWDESAASILPEYLRMYYTKMLSCFNEFEDILESREKYRVPYVQKEVSDQQSEVRADTIVNDRIGCIFKYRNYYKTVVLHPLLNQNVDGMVEHLQHYYLK